MEKIQNSNLLENINPFWEEIKVDIDNNKFKTVFYKLKKIYELILNYQYGDSIVGLEKYLIESIKDIFSKKQFKNLLKSLETIIKYIEEKDFVQAANIFNNKITEFNPNYNFDIVEVHTFVTKSDVLYQNKKYLKVFPNIYYNYDLIYENKNCVDIINKEFPFFLEILLLCRNIKKVIDNEIHEVIKECLDLINNKKDYEKAKNKLEAYKFNDLCEILLWILDIKTYLQFGINILGPINRKKAKKMMLKRFTYLFNNDKKVYENGLFANVMSEYSEYLLSRRSSKASKLRKEVLAKAKNKDATYEYAFFLYYFKYRHNFICFSISLLCIFVLVFTVVFALLSIYVF